MNRNKLTAFSLTCYDPDCVEAWVARHMTASYTYSFGLCHMALLDMEKGRFARLLTPAYVPEGRGRLFACRLGVREGCGVRFLGREGGETSFGIGRDNPVLFNPTVPFYDPTGAVVQGQPLPVVVAVLKQASLRRTLIRDEESLLPEVSGGISLCALPQPTRTGGMRFYERPSCSMS